jgi:TANK-binding kinase 1
VNDLQHPEIFRRVFIDKVAVGTDFEHNAEIWSVGITIYHVITGRLPFQAFGGRSNRLKM